MQVEWTGLASRQSGVLSVIVLCLSSCGLSVWVCVCVCVCMCVCARVCGEVYHHAVSVLCFLWFMASMGRDLEGCDEERCGTVLGAGCDQRTVSETAILCIPLFL